MRLPKLALALAAFAALTPAEASADSARVSDLVDELRGIQLRIAQGDRAAYPAQLNQLKTISAAIATASPKAGRTARSRSPFPILSGSRRRVAAQRRRNYRSERALARGALTYVTNHEADAIPLLRETDLTALDARLAGEVAARSVLERKADAKAQSIFSIRRRLPGG